MPLSWSGSFQEVQKKDELTGIPSGKQHKISDHRLDLLKNGDYDSSSNPRAFARELRNNLVEISHDKHFNVTYEPESSILLQRPDSEEEKNRKEQRIRQWKYDNYSF